LSSASDREMVLNEKDRGKHLATSCYFYSLTDGQVGQSRTVEMLREGREEGRRDEKRAHLIPNRKE